jgi:hypothetical protein
MTQNVFTDKDRKAWNEHLRELNALLADVERAEKANVPGIEPIKETCIGCMQGIQDLKKQYFPGKP